MSGPSPLIFSSVIPEVVASVFYSKNSIASITNPGYNIANRYIGLEVVLDVPARVFRHSLSRECICFIEVRYHSNLNYTALKHECVSICPHWTHYYRTSFQPFSLSSAWLSSPIVSSFSTTNRSAHSGHLREPDSQFSIVLLGMPSSSLIFACVSPANFRASRIVLISDSSVLI